MPKQYIEENWQWICLWWGLIIVSLYSRPLIPIDETRYLSVAWEMWNSDNYLVPHINGLPYSHKPPLLFWLIHFSWQLFGVGEWAGRLVAPAFGFGCLVLTVKLAKILWPNHRDVQLSAPFVLLGTVIWGIYGSLSMFDTLLTFLVLLSFVFILKMRDENSVLPGTGLALAVGLGILAKGPVILIYVLPPVILAPVWWLKGNSPSWGKWYGTAMLSIGMGIAIALSWAIPAAISGGQDYGQAILLKQTTGRIVQSFAHSRPFYWYLLLVPLILFPWFFWWPAWKDFSIRNSDCSLWFCLCCTIPALIILSCISGKQLHYVLPVLPVIALLIARSVRSLPQNSQTDRVPIILIYGILSILLFIIPQLPLEGGDRDILKNLPEIVAVAPLLCGAALLFTKSGSIINAIKVVALSSVIYIALLQVTVTNPLHDIFDQDDIGKRIHDVQERGAAVAIYPADMADQFQFSGRLTRPLAPIAAMDKLAVWSENNSQSFCVIYTKKSGYEILQGNGFAQKYRGGWLIFCPAEGLMERYTKWRTLLSN